MTLFYEKGGISTRVAWSRTDEQLYTLGSQTLRDEYRLPRSQVDAQLRYEVGSRYAITLSARNLTKEPERFSYGVLSLLRSSRLINQDFSLSLSHTF